MTDMTAAPEGGMLGAMRGGPTALPGASRYDLPFGATTAGAALEGFNTDADGATRAQMYSLLGGSAVSLALAVCIGVWGYKLVLRDVLGVPVVEAAEGPMRLAAAEPGGIVAAHQGLSVNAVPAEGGAAPPSDVLTLAPSTAGLAPEDMEVVQTMAEAGEPMGEAAAATEAAPATVASVAPADPAAPATDAMSAEEVLALADQIAAGAAPLTPLEPGATVEVETALADPAGAPAAAAAVIPASVPGVASALRPPARPRGSLAAVSEVETVAAEAAPEAASAVALTESISSGTNLVQLGAFDSPEIAAGEWERLMGGFGEFMGGKERVIQEAESGGRTFFRLRAMGFADLADARRFCAALVAEEANCIPVVVQ